MYEKQKELYERLNALPRKHAFIPPTAPTAPEFLAAPEINEWEREDGIDYRNYFGARDEGKSHDEAVEYCQQQRQRRGIEPK